MADAFLAHVTANPGQRMEHIAKGLGLPTAELTLLVKKLLGDGKLRVEGQKRRPSFRANKWGALPSPPTGESGHERSERSTSCSGPDCRYTLATAGKFCQLLPELRPMSDEILTLPEVAQLLKVAEKSVYTIAPKGELPAFKVGGQWRFRRTDLNAWIEVKTRRAAGEEESK